MSKFVFLVICSTLGFFYQCCHIIVGVYSPHVVFTADTVFIVVWTRSGFLRLFGTRVLIVMAPRIAIRQVLFVAFGCTFI